MLLFSSLFFALNDTLRTATLTRINSLLYPFLAHLAVMPDLGFTWLTIFNSSWQFSLAQADPFHILPVLTGILTFVQMRMAQPVDLAQTKETMTYAMQVMQFVLPLVMVGVTIAFAWHFAAGVALYGLVWLGLSIVQQYSAWGWGSLGVFPVQSQQKSVQTVSSHTPPMSRQTTSRQQRRKAKRRP